jgi:hypothetical protein
MIPADAIVSASTSNAPWLGPVRVAFDSQTSVLTAAGQFFRRSRYRLLPRGLFGEHDLRETILARASALRISLIAAGLEEVIVNVREAGGIFEIALTGPECCLREAHRLTEEKFMARSA